MTIHLLFLKKKKILLLEIYPKEEDSKLGREGGKKIFMCRCSYIY